MKVLASVPKYDGSKFDWSTGVGVADASDFRSKLWSRLFPDACDVGFVVRSHRTGKELVFSESRTVFGREGETLGWEYESIGSGPKVTIRIYND